MKRFTKQSLKIVNRKALFLLGRENPAADESALISDTYVLLAQKLLETKIIDEVHFIFTASPSGFNKRISTKGGFASGEKNFHFYSLKNWQGVKKHLFELAFIRGNYLEHNQILKTTNYQYGFFYAADSYFYPYQINPKYLEVIFVDEDYQAREIKEKYPNKLAVIFDKPVNPKIFYPRELKKKYDLCYIANFRQWKNHNMLFSAINKLPAKINPAPFVVKRCGIKIALAGKFEPNLRELKILLWKYQIDADLYEEVSLEKIAQILNQSKFSVQVAELDANPRSLTESLACNVPVLANSELTGGLHLINKNTGYKSPPCSFEKGIAYMLKNYKDFAPYNYYLNNLTPKKIITKCFIKPLRLLDKSK